MAASGALREPGDSWRTISVEGLGRTYLLHVPPAATGTVLPAVLAFHGGGSNAEQMADFSGLNEKADEAGFVVVYPNGVGRVERARGWNAGNCCGYAARHNIDDVGFVRRLLDDLPAAAPIDRSRIYATGMSNGAMMCYLLASCMAERLAAIAPVGGPMQSETCSPSRPMPVCHFHGTEDQFTPYHGGTGARSMSRTHFNSVEDTIRRWVEANGCRAEPEVEDLPVVVDDGTRVTRHTYAGCRDAVEVVLYTIHGCGHTWPGRQPLLQYLGPWTGNLIANDVIWDFFRRYERQQSPP